MTNWMVRLISFLCWPFIALLLAGALGLALAFLCLMIFLVVVCMVLILVLGWFAVWFVPLYKTADGKFHVGKPENRHEH
jgi:hypothetical protein